MNTHERILNELGNKIYTYIDTYPNQGVKEVLSKFSSYSSKEVVNSLELLEKHCYIRKIYQYNSFCYLATRTETITPEKKQETIADNKVVEPTVNSEELFELYAELEKDVKALQAMQLIYSLAYQGRHGCDRTAFYLDYHYWETNKDSRVLPKGERVFVAREDK